MADLSTLFGSDDEGIENGKWFPIPTELAKGQRPLRVKLRSVNSEKYRKENARLDKKYRVVYLANDGQLDPKTQDQKDCILGSRALVAEWEGVYDGGVEIPSTPQSIQDQLAKYPQFRRMLYVMAKTEDNYRSPEALVVEREEMAGN